MPPRAQRAAAPAVSAAWSTGRRSAQQRQYQDVEPLFLKTRLCKFHSVGVCSRGSACSFAHGPKELSPLPDLSRTQLCPSLLKTGYCTEGPACNFAHNKKELRPRPAKTRGAAGSSTADDHAEETPEEAHDPLGGEQALGELGGVPPQSPMYGHWQQPDGQPVMFTFMPMSPMMVAGMPFNADSMWLDAGCESDVSDWQSDWNPSDGCDWNQPSAEHSPGVSFCHDVSGPSLTDHDALAGDAGDAQSKDEPAPREEGQGGSDGSTCFNSDCCSDEGEWQFPRSVKNTFLEFGEQPTSNLRRSRSVPAALPALERL
jgi:hypothetical protein